MRRCEVVDRPTGFDLHDHVLWAHFGAEDWRKVLALFLQEGLVDNQRLVYAGTLQAEELLADLVALPDLDGLLATRRLELWSAHADPEEIGRSDVAAQAARLGSVVDAALAEGYTGIRLASEITDALAHVDDAEAHLRLECQVDQVAATHALVVMCGFDRLVVDPATMQGEFAVHPLRGCGTEAPRLHALGDDTWSLGGQVDMLSHAGFAQAMAALPDVMRGDVLHLEVGQLEFIDVAGLRALVRLAEAVADRGRVVLHQPPQWLARMLALTFGTVEGLELLEPERRRLRKLR